MLLKTRSGELSPRSGVDTIDAYVIVRILTGVTIDPSRRRTIPTREADRREVLVFRGVSRLLREGSFLGLGPVRQPLTRY